MDKKDEMLHKYTKNIMKMKSDLHSRTHSLNILSETVSLLLNSHLLTKLLLHLRDELLVR